MIGAIVVVLILLVGGIFILGFYISIMNSIRVSELKIKEADSGIDVALTKRYDEITKMVDVVKEYEKFESETILKTIKLRQGMSVEEKQDVEEKLTKVMEGVKITAEAYPNLKASEAFKNLQIAILDSEEHLQAARRLYNSNVTMYNQKIITFPSSIVAGNMGCMQKGYFKAEEKKKQDVEINF